MIRFALFPLAAMALSACDPAAIVRKAKDIDAPIVSCDSHSGSGCSFDQAPLRVLEEPVVLPKRPYKFFPTANRLEFVDAHGRSWVAPGRTLTDGASIPKIFVSIVGDPTSPEFINAAAVHDAYCGIGNEAGANYQNAKWEDVHKMFYDGLIVGGTEEFRAKMMFAAVWLGGPRWDTSRTLNHVPVARQQQAMRQTQTFINAAQPSLGQLMRYLKTKEAAMLAEFPVHPASPKYEDYGSNDGYDDYDGLSDY